MTHQRTTVHQEAQAFLLDSDELGELLREAQASLASVTLLAREVASEEWGAKAWQEEKDGALDGLRDVLARLRTAAEKSL